MRKSILIILLAILSLNSFSQSKKELKFNEVYRPQFHFTPEFNRMGSPISVILIDTVYHMFYQHNPHNLQEGFVNWCHAHSCDLINWKHDSILISQPEGISDSMISTPWWGSVIADNNEITTWYNSWSEGVYRIKGNNDFIWNDKEQLTGLEGITKCEPFVFNDKKNGKKYMLNFNRADSTMHLFESAEGLNWTKKTEFNYKFGLPCFTELPLEGMPDSTRWILLTEKGTYAICNFNDGKIEFASPVLKFDEGRKTGGSICFYDALKNRHILISELQSEQHPDLPANGQFSFPKEIKLIKTNSGIEIIKKPIDEIKNLYLKNYQWQNEKIYPGINNNILARIRETSFHLKGVIDLKNCDQFGFFVRSDKDRNGTEINYSVSRQQLTALNCKVNFKPVNNKIDIEILVDRSSIEIFIDGGRYSISSSFLPGQDKIRCELYTIGGEIVVDSLEVNTLKSIWRQ